MNITAEERKKLKGQGLISNKDGEHFSARVVNGNGVLSYKQLENLSEAARTYGNGSVSLTTRLTVEVPGIKYEDIEKFKEHIMKEGMVVGGTGPRVRPVVACKGTVCTHGIFDTQGMAAEIHRRFYEGYRNVILPHKFKIAVGGCSNNCIKPDLNDLGIVGQSIPNYNHELCRGCNKCAVMDVCPMDAQRIENGKMIIDKTICKNCGSCITKCPFNTIPDGKQGYSIYVGGRWGKKTNIGLKLNRLFTKEEALNVVEKAILLYKDKGVKGERFESTIERIGIEKIEEMLVSDDILNYKEEILQRL